MDTCISCGSVPTSKTTADVSELLLPDQLIWSQRQSDRSKDTKLPASGCRDASKQPNEPSLDSSTGESARERCSHVHTPAVMETRTNTHV